MSGNSEVSKETKNLTWILEKTIKELELPVRLEQAMKKVAGENATLREVVEHTEAEYLRSGNFGRKSLNELKKFLAEHCGDLYLGMEVPKLLPVPQEPAKSEESGKKDQDNNSLKLSFTGRIEIEFDPATKTGTIKFKLP